MKKSFVLYFFNKLSINAEDKALAYPLITQDSYFNTWSSGNELNQSVN